MTSEPVATTPESFQVFNRRQTIGVSAVHGGAINGVYLDEAVRKMGERELAREIVSVASVAAMRGRLSVREQVEAAAKAEGRTVTPATYEAMPDVPTAEDYDRYKTTTLK